MSSSTRPDDRNQIRDPYENFLYRSSQIGLVAAPVLILLPPRKLDLYTFLLSGAFVASGAHLYRRQQLDRASRGSLLLPARAQEVQINLAQEQGHRRLLEESGSAAEAKQGGSLLEEKAKEIWMGGETAGWRERRLKEERERIANGEGYGDMIMDQIWDVWNWGQKKTEELKEADEQVLKKQQREREFPKIGKD